MQAKSRARSTCPISFALEIFGDRWTLLVLRDLLLRGRRRYRELLRSEEGIATNVLADRLKRLERRGLIRKLRDEADGRQFVYAATPLAVSLVPMLIEMSVWGARSGAGSDVDPAFIARFETDREDLIAEIQAEVRRSNGLA
jgi:DNA-binding HxlR family transcriptional regulator